MDMKIYHNPRCSKSRQTLAFIEDANIKPQVVLYLQDGLTSEELHTAIEAYGFENAGDLLRTKDIRKDGLSVPESVDDIVRFLVKNPKYMERPLVLKGKRAILGRPPENVQHLL
jgi:arsenate reductase